MRARRGFSMLEMVIVLLVIAILAFMAIPDMSIATVRGQLKESNSLIDVAKAGVLRFYVANGKMPFDNAEAELPEATKMVGKFVSRIDVKDGVVNVTWGNSIFAALKDTKLSYRPAYVDGQPMVPISWVCGQAAVPTGMKVGGADASSMPPKYTPLECKGSSAK